MHTRTIVLILVAILGCIGIVVGSGVLDLGKAPVPVTEEQPAVLSFLDCEAAGNPVQESYPRQCATPDGRSFTEELAAPEPTYLNASADNIVVETPTPGSVTGKEFQVRGMARGPWFFEASFPIEVRDTAGNLLDQSIGEPIGTASWMTEDFVPFASTITIPSTFTGEAIVTLMNDNPSGLPENARSVSFPITIEY